MQLRAEIQTFECFLYYNKVCDAQHCLLYSMVNITMSDVLIPITLENMKMFAK